MKIGFAKTDITPRVGVELCGFGPFLNRHSIAVRDNLWARAMAVSNGDKTVIIVSCDLIGVEASLVAKVREMVTAKTGVGADSIMVHCTHTHSGPATINLFGWGQQDYPYMNILPGRIAGACVNAFENLTDGKLSHAAVKCEGIGLNREYDIDAPPLDEVLKDDWRTAKPELTDTTVHVIKATDGDGKLLGYCGYFGCHPVVCCQTTRYIHGDYPGIANSNLEREFPGAVGLFLQGAQGDVNSCCVHKPEQESLLALDIIAGRYANSVRAGLKAAKPISDDKIDAKSMMADISRKQITRERLEEILAEKQAIINAPDASDKDQEVRMASVFAQSIEDMLKGLDAGFDYAFPVEVQGIRIGPIALLGSPFEIFQAIKNDAVAGASAPIPLVMGLTNDLQGYAPDKTKAEQGGYAADMVPVMLGKLPYAKIHEELSNHLIAMDHKLFAEG